MYLKRLEIAGFKSFAKKSVFEFTAPVTAIVGPNGSGKSNVAESIRFVLGEQSMKSMRGKRGEDLIWNGSQSAPRSNHASVAIVFDNSDKVFDVDYDEVSVRREVFRDGTNRYFINGTQVRLRDVVELLAKVHIGATGHHIISQGEADRVLSAGVKERRMIIEEALGLKIYKWKIEESEKKLAKTEENIKQVESLRREIAPHVRFLKKQVEKIEKAKAMRERLKDLYAEYLKREDVYIRAQKRILEERLAEPKHALGELELRLDEAKKKLEEGKKESPKAQELVAIEGEITAAQARRDEVFRALGKVEGMIELVMRRQTHAIPAEKREAHIPLSKVKHFTESISERIEAVLNHGSADMLRSALEEIKQLTERFAKTVSGGASSEQGRGDQGPENELRALQKEKAGLERDLAEAESVLASLRKRYAAIKHAIEEEKDTSRDVERSIFQMMAKKSELNATIQSIKNEIAIIEKREQALKEEIREGVALIGGDITMYETFAISEEEVLAEERGRQEARRKEIEKIKIKLEETGGAADDDILKEYEEVTSRDRFLERELEDLKKSKESLKRLIAELTETLNTEFKSGIEKINKQFKEFFALMFGGGTAALTVVAQRKRRRGDTDMALNLSPDEDEAEEGIDVEVHLPRKKIRGLQMLSGGERALTSIALIFAVSQVNPPPFLVLDETDAALDEANSRKYGDMIENLSKRSQLVVITHNRETMSRAGVLYGVTMGSDAVSKLLSIKFEEAQGYAK